MTIYYIISVTTDAGHKRRHKMTYYYKGQKVRTSDNIYTHGVYYNGKVIACCGSEYLALKRLHQEFHYREEQIEQNQDNPEYLKILYERIQSLCIVVLEAK